MSRDRAIDPPPVDKYWPCCSCQRWFDSSDMEVVGNRTMCDGCLEEE